MDKKAEEIILSDVKKVLEEFKESSSSQRSSTWYVGSITITLELEDKEIRRNEKRRYETY